jgi:hypothetical protein
VKVIEAYLSARLKYFQNRHSLALAHTVPIGGRHVVYLMWSTLGVAGSLPITKHTSFHVLIIKMRARNPEFLVFLLYRMIVLSLILHSHGCDFVFPIPSTDVSGEHIAYLTVGIDVHVFTIQHLLPSPTHRKTLQPIHLEWKWVASFSLITRTVSWV